MVCSEKRIRAACPGSGNYLPGATLSENISGIINSTDALAVALHLNNISGFTLSGAALAAADANADQ
ncbi:MAG: hypothetical protein PHX39_01940 [Bacteroidales bacterium]|nr:hypothetical protein [Bacteroidales bacterium]